MGTAEQRATSDGRRRHGGGAALALALAAAMATVAGACGGGEQHDPLAARTDATTGVTIAGPAESIAGPAAPAQPDTDPATLYVSAASGDDAGDGQAPETAWASLQAGLDRLAPGQTLFVMDGRYDERAEPDYAHYILRPSGTADAWINVAAAPGHHPLIVASNGNGLSVQGSYVAVSGLQVTGERFDTENSYGWGINIRNAHHVRISGNTISAMAVGGIGSVETSNLEIYGNVVFENAFWGPEQGSGISLWHSVDAGLGPGPDGYHDKIVGNLVYRNENKVFSEWLEHDGITDGNGIIIDQADETGYTGRALVANNVVFDNGGRGILVLESSRVDVMFNTTYHNGRTEGLEGGPVELAAGRADDVRLVNNLVWSRPGVPDVAVTESTGVVMGGNVLVTDSPSGLATELDLVLSDDPGVGRPAVDAAVADFRPVAGSALVDAAIAVDPQLLFDADLSPRAAGAADVGAYELAG